MGGAEKRAGMFRPLVPPATLDPVAEALALHRHGLEMMTAANRLAFGWMRDAAAQHAAITRRTFEQMAETARRVAAADAPPDQAEAMLAMMERAQALGLETAQEIAGLMQRMQGEATALLGQALLPGEE
jgi:hypothetical protein